MAGVDGGDEDIESGLAGWGDGGVVDGGVADVDGKVVGDDSFGLDVLDVAAVVVGEDDVVVWLFGVDFINAEVEHVGGAGVFFALHFSDRTGVSVEEGGDGVGVVGIHDDIICGDDFAVGGFDGGDGCAVEVGLFDGGGKPEIAAVFLEDGGHSFGYFAEAALDVVDAVFVFEVGEDGEECGAFPRGHAEVFGLEGEGDFEAVVLEIVFEDIDDGLAGGDVGGGFDESGAE